MLSWINRIHSKKLTLMLGDPSQIVAYVDQLEAEISSLKSEICQLKAQLDNKSAEIQYWQAVDRSSR